jgi:hypothetical protein
MPISHCYTAAARKSGIFKKTVQSDPKTTPEVATAPVLEKVLRGFYSTQMGFERI